MFEIANEHDPGMEYMSVNAGVKNLYPLLFVKYRNGLYDLDTLNGHNGHNRDGQFSNCLKLQTNMTPG